MVLSLFLGENLLIVIKIYTKFLVAIKSMEFLNYHQFMVFDSLIAITVNSSQILHC
jgi:hypothetical protein